MRLRAGALVLLTLADGTSVGGTVRRSWRWRTMRLDNATSYTAGPADIDGYLLVSHRSILAVQVVG